ncbi:uncharacterized protein METZ01_LOCUS198309, partial [marine metagenome]
VFGEGCDTACLGLLPSRGAEGDESSPPGHVYGEPVERLGTRAIVRRAPIGDARAGSLDAEYGRQVAG